MVKHTIYIYRERERERDIQTIYIYIYMGEGAGGRPLWWCSPAHVGWGWGWWGWACMPLFIFKSRSIAQTSERSLIQSMLTHARLSSFTVHMLLHRCVTTKLKRVFAYCTFQTCVCISWMPDLSFDMFSYIAFSRRVFLYIHSYIVGIRNVILDMCLAIWV